ncbi:heavy metal translocating P-type ATPase, partial [Enterococcus faecium]
SKIKRFEPKYVTLVLAVFPLIVLGGALLFQLTWAESFYRGLVFLIAASPCALAASAVPATLSGISNLAKQGVLFKGGSFLSNLA